MPPPDRLAPSGLVSSFSSWSSLAVETTTIAHSWGIGDKEMIPGVGGHDILIWLVEKIAGGSGFEVKSESKMLQNSTQKN